MATPLETGIDWGTKIEAGVVTYRFAEEGGVYVGVTAYEWVDYEILQVERAFALFDAFLGNTGANALHGHHDFLVAA